MGVSALNLGMICCYYYIGYTTVELFASSLQPNTKLRGLLEILAAAPEFGQIAVRHREDELLRALALHCPLKVAGGPDGAPPRYDEPAAKVHVLLQCHFCRKELPRDLGHDLRPLVEKSARLLQAMVDVVSSSGWLAPALACMELSQMVTQALWETDSPLLQLPHFTPELAKRCAASGVEGIFELMVRARAAGAAGPPRPRRADPRAPDRAGRHPPAGARGRRAQGAARDGPQAAGGRGARVQPLPERRPQL